MIISWVGVSSPNSFWNMNIIRRQDNNNKIFPSDIRCHGKSLKEKKYSPEIIDGNASRKPTWRVGQVCLNHVFRFVRRYKEAGISGVYTYSFQLRKTFGIDVSSPITLLFRSYL